ncbi:MAG TPA: hypothetical protein VKV34_00675 [Thermoleophilia bacterium]|nr:hypothetical protein [Thermoleophilia bacterium]
MTTKQQQQEPSRELRRVAQWLAAQGQGDLGDRILKGEHWEWNPNDRLGTNQRGNARTGVRR